jgi:hypothetical protein
MCEIRCDNFGIHFRSLLALSFLIRPLLPTHCRCRGLLWHLVTLNDTHTHTHKHSRLDSPGREIGLSQTPLRNNTQHSQQTDIHAPGRISNTESQKASSRRPTPQTALQFEALTKMNVVLRVTTPAQNSSNDKTSKIERPGSHVAVLKSFGCPGNIAKQSANTA